MRVPGLGFGRDPQRTPMQWDASPGAGFTSGSPWLPIAGNVAAVNVEAQKADATSMLYLYQALTALRRREPALSIGSWSPVITEKDLFAYRRKHDGRAFLIALNLGAEPLAAVLPDDLQGELLLSTHLDRDGEAIGNEIDLRECEGVIVGLHGSSA